ncbi:MAG TPA: acylphosphatase [Rhodoglobus sp.]|nr:acylphosphatase [Rhodoglobus sp.]
MEPIRRHAIVRGLVQGVGFRFAARDEASRAGLTGWVRNLDDGTVEAEVQGAPDAVGRMLEWLGHGPPGAQVEGLDARECGPVAADHAFRIER